MFGLKQYIYLGVGVLASGVLAIGGYKLYQAGYDKATVQCQTNTLEAVEKALDKQAVNHLKHLNRALERAKEDRIIEKQIEKVYVEIPKVVHKTVLAKPQCSDLGLDILRLWNKPISTVYYREGDKAKAAAPLANPVSATSKGYQF